MQTYLLLIIIYTITRDLTTGFRSHSMAFEIWINIEGLVKMAQTRLVRALFECQNLLWRSQSDLAARAGVSPNVVSAVLNGSYALTDSARWTREEDNTWSDQGGKKPDGRQYLSWARALVRLYKFAYSESETKRPIEEILKDYHLETSNPHVARAAAEFLVSGFEADGVSDLEGGQSKVNFDMVTTIDLDNRSATINALDSFLRKLAHNSVCLVFSMNTLIEFDTNTVNVALKERVDSILADALKRGISLLYFFPNEEFVEGHLADESSRRARRVITRALEDAEYSIERFERHHQSGQGCLEVFKVKTYLFQPGENQIVVLPENGQAPSFNTSVDADDGRRLVIPLAEVGQSLVKAEVVKLIEDLKASARDNEKIALCEGILQRLGEGDCRNAA